MGSVRKEIKGNRYGMWVALGEYYYTPPTKSGRKLLMEKCKCDCGTIKYVQRSHLFSGASTCCGCVGDKKFSERSKIQNRKHGMEGTIPYRKFMSAKARCNYKNDSSYYRYGGRGIKFERKDFSDFRKDMGDAYYEHCAKYGEKDTTLDRIDVDGNYCKENCRRATWKEQYNNMSTNHKVEYKGVKYNSLSAMCEDLGLKYRLVQDRLRYGWSVEDAVEKPLDTKHSLKGVKKTE